MQWGRGLFRLWLVLSAVWVVTAGTVSWLHFYEGAFGGERWAGAEPMSPEICKTAQLEKIPSPAASTPLLPAGVREKLSDALYNYVYAKALTREEYDKRTAGLSAAQVADAAYKAFYDGKITRGAFNEKLSMVQREMTDAEVFSPQHSTEECEAIQRRAISEWRWRIADHIAVPLAPPIVVLFIAWVMAWVARGFRPTPAAN